MRALKKGTDWSFVLRSREQQQKGWGWRGALHPHHSKRSANTGSQHLPLPVEGELLQPPSCCPPQIGAPPKQLSDHTQRPHWALAALPLGNYTLGANLLPFLGEADRARKRRALTFKQHPEAKLLFQMTAWAYSYLGILYPIPNRVYLTLKLLVEVRESWQSKLPYSLRKLNRVIQQIPTW